MQSSVKKWYLVFACCQNWYFRCWVEIHILFYSTHLSKTDTSMPNPHHFVGWIIPSSLSLPQQMANLTTATANLQRRKTTPATTMSTAPTKALIKVVHPWPGWRCLAPEGKPMEICPLVFWATWRRSKFNVHVPYRDLFPPFVFLFKGCKKYSGG